MSRSNIERLNEQHQSDSSDDDNDDLVTFQFESNTISFNYSQLFRYSKHIRDDYQFSDMPRRLIQELQNIRDQFAIDAGSIVLFFQLLSQGFVVGEDRALTYRQCVDLLKMSEIFCVKKLDKQVRQHLRGRRVDVGFIIEAISFEASAAARGGAGFRVGEQMEDALAARVGECLADERFASLPAPVVYRVVARSGAAPCDALYDFARRAGSGMRALLSFVDACELSEGRLRELCESEDCGEWSPFLRCDVRRVLDLRERSARLQQENEQFRTQLSDTEGEVSRLRARLDEFVSPIRGSIAAEAMHDLLVSAHINLQLNGASLDASSSRYILSTSGEETLGANAYAGGEAITSPSQRTVDFGVRAGRYYVRALIRDNRGRTRELVSNMVVARGTSIGLGYSGRPAVVALGAGRFLLEAWGAQGGDSVGSRENGQPGIGGLGGYSVGRLTLAHPAKVHVFVGGAGRSAAEADGSETAGGFPDGGGTKTGHSGNYASVPGTGGGSTSVRVGSDSLLARVIVAGGGGGAAGDSRRTNHGGFGGGPSGGNCFYNDQTQSRGAGTQTGSSPGYGSGKNGDAGRFGQGAAGKYKKNGNSGGGGGGGWYGGGGGGYGDSVYCSSGGGGSGWIYTQASLAAWSAGDSSRAGQFELDASHFLSEARTYAGNAEFPSPGGQGVETGHRGNGYARITPE